MAPTVQLQPTEQLIHFGLPDGTSLDLDILQDPQTLKEFVSCDQCQTVVSLRANRNLHGFETHRSSDKCRKTADKLIKASTVAKRSSALGSLGLQPSLSLSEYFYAR
jgi:hypothetical protein